MIPSSSRNHFAIIFIWLSNIVVKVVSGSYGDRSYKFQQCLQQCLGNNCTISSRFEEQQPFCEKLLQWNCKDECKYECMWITVDAFQKDHLSVPQFYGKVKSTYLVIDNIVQISLISWV